MASMSRPGSRMENVRPSGLKAPSSRLPMASSTTRPLHESSQSELNARTHATTKMAPPPVPAKRKGNEGVSETIAKQRKTLAERAGEPYSHSRSQSAQVRTQKSTATLPRATKPHQSQIGRPASAQSQTGIRRAPSRLQDYTTEEEEDAEYEEGRRKAWDTRERLELMDRTLHDFGVRMEENVTSQQSLEETIRVYKGRVEELQHNNHKITSEYEAAVTDLERARQDLQTTINDLQQARRDHERSTFEIERKYERELHDNQLQHEKQMQRVERESELAVNQLEVEVKGMKADLEKDKHSALAELQTSQLQEIDRLRTTHDAMLSAVRQELDQMKQAGEGRAAESATQVQMLRESISTLQGQLTIANAMEDSLRSEISAAQSRNRILEQDKSTLINKAHFLEGNQEAQSQEFSNMTRRLQIAEAQAQQAVDQLRKEETARRRLNAQILELKGNIRVFARMRPVLENEEDPMQVDFPDVDDLDGKKVMLMHAPTTYTATGKERNEKFNYGFDRVFTPAATNADVFDECRDLVQSVIDGYNVSILSYGQTGSGKTFGMSGIDGIIPSSIELLLSEIERVKAKGWQYHVEASFVEVYNETLNDLLGDAKTWEKEEDTGARTRSQAKHEIHHDNVTGKTTVTNLTSVVIWPPAIETDSIEDDARSYTKETVDRILETATGNRRVAATKANERSSRSHSVFMLTLRGACEATQESSEGILNLVDLAGSERLKHSGAEGSRAKETAAINTSLKSLGDVIEKVGSGGHVPYRNSKLTYLLQSSLGGTAARGKSSRTLMLLHLSPLQAHWQETKTSLQFGVKVHGTHIGHAKK